MLAAKRARLPDGLNVVCHVIDCPPTHGGPDWLRYASPIALEEYHAPGSAVNCITCWIVADTVTGAEAKVSLCEDEDELFDQRPKKADGLSLHQVFETSALSLVLSNPNARAGAAARSWSRLS